MRNSILSLFISIFLCQFGSTQRPFEAQLLSQFDPPTSDFPVYAGVQFNDIWGYASPGGLEVAIVGNSRYVLFLDVTEPANGNIPWTSTEIYRHAPGQDVIWRDFKTYENYAYGVCDGCSEGLWVYDLSGLDCGDPITPVTNITAQFGQAHNIYIDEENARLYASGVPGSVDLHIYDLAANPANPQLIASVDFNQVSGIGSSLYVHDIYVRDNIAYCSHGYTGFYIWDMNDLSNVGSTSSGGTIQLLADGDYNGYNHSSWLTEDGNYAVVAEEVPGGEPLVTVDLSQLFSNNSISFVDDFQHRLEINASGFPTPHNPFIRNDYVFIAYYEDGLKVYDYSDPSAPLLHSFYDTYPANNGFYSGTEGAWGCYPFLPSGNVLISDITYGIHLLGVAGTENCADGIQNQDETGVDCGGKYCLPCDTCSDGIQNQDETGIDCGGSICCAPCTGATCSDGIQNQDETGIDCGGTICPPCETCNDGIQNQDETGIDCGGSICMACETCNDGIQNQDETGIDCGGSICMACETCNDGIQNQDETGIDCGGAICMACETCNDGIQNQDETGIDCGGAICPACDACNDGIQNQDETGIDCGGTICPPCTSCNDGIQNVNETGVDCGGPDCAPCDCDGNNLVINSNNANANGVYNYNNIVITSGAAVMNASTNASYYAGNYLQLNPNFEVVSGAELLLAIEECQ